MISFRSFKALSISALLMEPSPSLGLWGEVFAIYNHSCHVLAADGRIICLADRHLDDGPITLRVDFPWHLNIKALGARAGMPLRVEGEDWLLGEDVLLRVSGATRWVPPAISGFASRSTVLRRLRILRHCLKRDVPEAGLAPLVWHADVLAQGRPVIFDSASLLARVATQRAAKLVQGVWARDEREIDDGVRGLIGIGPGLTPSGDDLLAGFMIGLIAVLDSRDRATEGHRLEQPALQGLHDVVAELGRTIIRHAAGGTTQISNALLSHAVKGVGSDSVHRLLQALLQRDDALEPTQAALEVATPGHTSGWDCLAGLLVGVHLGLRLAEAPAVGRDGFDCNAKLKTTV
jgi:hypothetical protein